MYEGTYAGTLVPYDAIDPQLAWLRGEIIREREPRPKYGGVDPSRLPWLEQRLRDLYGFNLTRNGQFDKAVMPCLT